MNKEKLINELESIVDSVGYDEVLDALQTVAYLKAEHLRTNWQDEQSAKHQEYIGRLLGQYANKIAEIQ